MREIDLTLRKEFLKNPTPQDRFEDTNSYLNKMGYEDQRRAKADILGFDDFKKRMLSFILPCWQYLEFFKEDNDGKYNISSDINTHEDIFRITGVLTNTLKLEYYAAYGSENVCDCCGGFRSSLLNAQSYTLCDRCEKDFRDQKETFWERRPRLTEEIWID